MQELENTLINIEQIIKTFIQNKFESLNINEKEINRKINREIKVNFEFSKELSLGDYTLSAPLAYGKDLRLSPLNLAEEIVKILNSENKLNINVVFEKIEIKNPGFINFFLNKNILRNSINNFEFINTKFTGKNVLLEHSSPNLFKPFHIGHLMNNFIGEYIKRSVQISNPSKLTTMSYPSDISLGIAKAIYILKLSGGLEIAKTKYEGDELIKYLGSCYVRGIKIYAEDESIHSEVKNIARDLYTMSGENYKEFYETKILSEIYFKKMLSKLGSEFDRFYYESSAGVICTDIIQQNTKDINDNKTFKRSEGAIVYMPKESRKDINTTVFINSEGHPTYAGKDIGLMEFKFDAYDPDYSIYVTDAEQMQHFKTVFAAANDMSDKWGLRVNKSIHIMHGRMTLLGQKMSSRNGGVPTAEEIINLVLDEVIAKSSDKLDNLNSIEKIKLQKEIALAALRINILRAKPGVNIDFDPERATSFDGDSGPYLCYTHARCCSLLEKGYEQNLIPTIGITTELTDLERKLFQYKKVLQEATNEIAPQKLVTYLFELCKLFNSYYTNNIILSEDKNTSEHRLYIVEKVKDTLKQALYILGINAPDKM